jgi:hypothetical protein
LPLLDHFATRPVLASVDFIQLEFIFYLNAKMIEAYLSAARRNREIHARIIKHPLRIICPDDCGLCGEQR